MLIIRDKKSKKYFWRALIFIAVAVILFILKNFIKDKNAADFIFILGAAACILAVWFYYKSLSHSLELIVKPALKKAFSRLKKSWNETVKKIRKKLGLSEKNWRMKGTDSFNFVLPSWGRKKGKKMDFGKTRIKWNEEPNNPWRIRYIYTKYIVKRVKKGMKFKGSMTPFENGEILGNGCPYPKIFELYSVSRYAPLDTSKNVVSDEIVDEAMDKLLK